MRKVFFEFVQKSDGSTTGQRRQYVCGVRSRSSISRTTNTSRLQTPNTSTADEKEWRAESGSATNSEVELVVDSYVSDEHGKVEHIAAECFKLPLEAEDEGGVTSVTSASVLDMVGTPFTISCTLR